MRRTNRRTSGFTLIELLIAIALMVMLLAAVTMIFAGTTDTVATQDHDGPGVSEGVLL